MACKSYACTACACVNPLSVCETPSCRVNVLSCVPALHPANNIQLRGPRSRRLTGRRRERGTRVPLGEDVCPPPAVVQQSHIREPFPPLFVVTVHSRAMHEWPTPRVMTRCLVCRCLQRPDAKGGTPWRDVHLLSLLLLHIQHTPPLTFIHATFSPLPNYPQDWLLSYEGLAGSLGAATWQARTTHGKDAGPLLARGTKHPRCLRKRTWD